MELLQQSSPKLTILGGTSTLVASGLAARALRAKLARMAVRGHRDGVGIPVVLVHEGEGLIVTIETKSGYSYRGYMESAEDNMNSSLKDVTATGPRGKVTRMERVFVRGSQIVYIVFPDLLAEAPMFRRVALAAKGITVAGGLGRGRQAAIGARGMFMLRRVFVSRSCVEGYLLATEP